MNEFEKVISKINQIENFDFGFSELNNYIKQAEKGSLITIGARPAVGKTGFLIGLINNFMAQDKNICFYSIENNKEKMIRKIFARVARADLHNQIDNELKELMLDNARLYDDKKLNIIDKSSLAVEEVEEDIRNNNYEIVLIDNIQSLKTLNVSRDETDYIAKELRRIAKENNLIIILTSQISRQVEKRVNKIPKLIDIKNTSCLEDVSDVVIMLYRENYYDLFCDNNSAQICVLKNNFGNIGYFELEFVYGFFYEKQKYDNIWQEDEKMNIDIDELKKQLKTTKEINDSYANGKKSYSFEMQKEDFENEKFVPYKDFDERIEVSNLGRVKFNGVIQEQTDEYTSTGYLYLKNYRKIEDELKKKFNDEFVYEMVAKAHLPKQPNDKCKYDVHHKDNDGYNNTKDNLIWLKRCEHKAIHPFMKLHDICKNCERKYNND